jgi:hypothetical protein
MVIQESRDYQKLLAKAPGSAARRTVHLSLTSGGRTLVYQLFVLSLETQHDIKRERERNLVRQLKKKDKSVEDNSHINDLDQKTSLKMDELPQERLGRNQVRRKENTMRSKNLIPLPKK